MQRWPQAWRAVGWLLAWLGLLSWLGAMFCFFFIGIGRPPRVVGFALAGGLGVLGFAALAGIGVIGVRLRRVAGGPQRMPDPQRTAAVRRGLKWGLLGYLPLGGGLAWIIFATSIWTGQKGVLLGAGGLMVGVAGSFALNLPFMRALGPTRGRLGVSAERLTHISIAVAVTMAATLIGLGVALPQR